MLYRINARSEPFEEAFAAAAIPYQVRDGAFLRRPGPRAVMQRLKRSSPVRWPRPSRRSPTSSASTPRPQPDADEEVTRQSDLGRMRSLAAEFERAGGGDAAAFGAELAKRFSTEHSGRGVNLLTYHRAKGLEFDAVFLPRLLDGELPFRSGRAKADPEEERRLLYVGITRARRYLFLTWPSAGRARPSPFLDEMELAPSMPSSAKAAPGPAVTVGRGGAAVRPAQGVAPQARARRRRPRVRRVPRPHARRDRRAPVHGLGRSRRDLGRRAGQARTLRGRGARGRRGRVTV